MTKAPDASPFEGGYVYILRLEHGCWYVGHTLNLYDRIRDHFKNGHRTQWTKLHSPIGLQAYFVGTIEDELSTTEAMIHRFGLENVRGAAPYTLAKLSEKAKTRELSPITMTLPSLDPRDSLDYTTMKYPPKFRRVRTRAAT